jgi:hypothetical protein
LLGVFNIRRRDTILLFGMGIAGFGIFILLA